MFHGMLFHCKTLDAASYYFLNFNNKIQLILFITKKKCKNGMGLFKRKTNKNDSAQK